MKNQVQGRLSDGDLRRNKSSLSQYQNQSPKSNVRSLNQQFMELKNISQQSIKKSPSLTKKKSKNLNYNDLRHSYHFYQESPVKQLYPSNSIRDHTTQQSQQQSNMDPNLNLDILARKLDEIANNLCSPPQKINSANKKSQSQYEAESPIKVEPDDIMVKSQTWQTQTIPTKAAVSNKKSTPNPTRTDPNQSTSRLRARQVQTTPFQVESQRLLKQNSLREYRHYSQKKQEVSLLHPVLNNQHNNDIHRDKITKILTHRNLLLTGSHDYYLKLINHLDNNLVAQFKHKRHVTALCKNDQTFASGSQVLLSKLNYQFQDNFIRIFSFKNLQQIKSFKAHNSKITNLEFFQQYLVSSGTDNIVKIWDQNKFNNIRQISSNLQVNTIKCDDNFIWMGGQDRYLKGYNAQVFNKQFIYFQKQQEPTFKINCEFQINTMCFDQNHILVGGQSFLKFYDIRKISKTLNLITLDDEINSILKLNSNLYALAINNQIVLVQNNQLIKHDAWRHNEKIYDLATSYNKLYSVGTELKSWMVQI